jgi:hypothetical protein
MISDRAVFEMNRIRQVATQLADLSNLFFETDDYRNFRTRVFGVLERREARLKLGLTEQWGAALLGPAGSGKSRLTTKIIAEYASLADATGGREFGTKIVIAIVPGQATVKDTCKAILNALGYGISRAHDEDHLIGRVVFQMKEQKVAGLHLDEIQDAGRYKTSGSMGQFSKRFRNLMQNEEWPICLILTATTEAKSFINHDHTLSRRLKPIEMSPARLEVDGPVVREAMGTFLRTLEMQRHPELDEGKFMARLLHAGAQCFGIAIELVQEAIGVAMMAGETTLTADHFIDAYFEQTDCDDELNPFLSNNWKVIDTRTAMDRAIRESKSKKKMTRG